MNLSIFKRVQIANRKELFKYLLFAITIIYSFSFSLWSKWVDNCFWFNMADYYKENVMTIGSTWLCHVWNLLFDHSFFMYRVLGWIIGMITFCFPYFYLVKKSEYTKYLPFLSIGILLFKPSCYAPDAPSGLFLIIIACYVIKHEFLDYKDVLFLAVLSGLLILFRYPNIVGVVLLLLYLILVYNNIYKKLLFPCLYLVASVAFYILFFYVIEGNLDFILKTHSNISSPISTADVRHTPKALLETYWHAFCGISVMFLTVYGFIRLVTTKFLDLRDNIVYSVICCVALFYILSIRNVLVDCLNGWHTLYSSFVVYGIILYTLLYNKSYKGVLLCLFVLSLGLAKVAGSDTGFLKSFSYYAPFTPLLFIRFWPMVKVHIISKCLLITFVIVAILSLNQHFRAYRLFSDLPNYPQFVPEDEYQMNGSRYQLTKKYGVKNHMIFYGQLSHYIYTMTNSERMYRYNYWQDANDTVQIARICEVASKDPLCSVYDYTNSDFLKAGLLSKGHRLIFENQYARVYVKK